MLSSNSGGEITIELTEKILKCLKTSKFLAGLTSRERSDVEEILIFMELAATQSKNGRVVLSTDLLNRVLRYAMKSQDWLITLVSELRTVSMSELNSST